MTARPLRSETTASLRAARAEYVALIDSLFAADIEQLLAQTIVSIDVELESRRSEASIPTLVAAGVAMAPNGWLA